MVGRESSSFEKEAPKMATMPCPSGTTTGKAQQLVFTIYMTTDDNNRAQPSTLASENCSQKMKWLLTFCSTIVCFIKLPRSQALRLKGLRARLPGIEQG